MPINVLIPEEIPSHNKGEAALLFGLMESLKPFGDTRVALFSLHPDLDRENYGQEVTVVDADGVAPAHMLHGQATGGARFINYLTFMLQHAAFGLLYKIMGAHALHIMRHPVFRAYVETDLILMSHDSMYTPFYHGTQALLFHFMKKPAMIYAATIKRRGGDSTSMKSRFIDAWVAYTSRRTSAITLREEFSKRYLEEIGLAFPSMPISVYPDLAFLVQAIPREAALEILKAEKAPLDQPLAGMAISQRKLDFAFPGREVENRHGKALSPIVDAVNHLTGALGMTVLFIPHATGPEPILDDRVTAEMIREQAMHPEKIIIIRNEYSCQALKGLASCLDITVGTRLHFTIDAVSCSVPSLLIAHAGDVRCHGIIGEMLDMGEYVYDIDEIEAHSLIQRIDLLWTNRREIQERLSERMKSIREAACLHGKTALSLLGPSISG